jgi:hypothetical protein
VQIFERCVGVNILASLSVEIFHAHHERTTSLSRAQPRGPEGARMTHVQIAGGRGRQASAISGGGLL